MPGDKTCCRTDISQKNILVITVGYPEHGNVVYLLDFQNYFCCESLSQWKVLHLLIMMLKASQMHFFKKIQAKRGLPCTYQFWTWHKVCIAWLCNGVISNHVEIIRFSVIMTNIFSRLQLHPWLLQSLWIPLTADVRTGLTTHESYQRSFHQMFFYKTCAVKQLMQQCPGSVCE